MEPEIEDESEARSGEDSWAQAETRRLMELVRFLARTLAVNNSALARNANVPMATLVRYFKGEGEPKLEFLLAMVQALGLEVREFFELAYPDAPPLTPARAKIGRIIQAPPPAGRRAPPALRHPRGTLAPRPRGPPAPGGAQLGAAQRHGADDGTAPERHAGAPGRTRWKGGSPQGEGGGVEAPHPLAPSPLPSLPAGVGR